MPHLIRTAKTAVVRYITPKLLRQNYMHFILLKKKSIFWARLVWIQSTLLKLCWCKHEETEIQVSPTVCLSFSNFLERKFGNKVCWNKQENNSSITSRVICDTQLQELNQNPVLRITNIPAESLFLGWKQMVHASRPDFNLSCNHVNLKLFCWSLCRGFFSQ